MPGWKGSTRKARLPRDWEQRRAAVRRRARGQCEWVERGGRCAAVGNQCDHIIHGDDHSLPNLQWLCARHHAMKSSSEGGSARRRKFKRPSRAARPQEKHPGLKSSA